MNNLLILLIILTLSLLFIIIKKTNKLIIFFFVASIILTVLLINNNLVSKVPQIINKDIPQPENKIEQQTDKKIVIGNEKPTPSSENKNATQLFTDKERAFSIEYPDYLKPEQMPSGELAFILWGPTQAENTEFFDGINISFQSLPIDGLTLTDRVEEEREMLISIYGNTLSKIDPITIDNAKGYIFNDHMAQYIYLPQNNQRYLYIVNMSADPNNLGYKETVYKMIESIKILN